MGLFNFIKDSSKRFITEEKYNENKAAQKEMNTETLHQLSTHGTLENSELKLEFFFYTNEQDKASNLAIELKKLGYEIDTVDVAAGDKNLWVVSGWTTKIQMNEASVTAWTAQMCELGYENDCEFDGWGTFPDQE